MPSFTSWLIRLYIKYVRRSKIVFNSVENTLRNVQDSYIRPQSFLPPQHLGANIILDRVDVNEWPLYRVSARRADSVRESSKEPRRAMLYVHGGAFFREIALQHYHLAADFARETGLDVLIPIYPLIPRPTATAKQLAAGLIDICRLSLQPVVCIAGDSAGGMLAIATAQQLNDGYPQLLASIRCLILISPVLDCALDHPEVLRLAEDDPWLGVDGLRALGEKLAAGLSLKDPVVSPLYGDIKNLPPIMLVCGTADMLCADARRLKSKFLGRDIIEAEAGGIILDRFTYVEEKDMTHVYPLLPHPEGREMRRHILQFVSKHVA